MEMNEYQQKAKATAVYPDNVAIEYTAFGLCSEAGEVAGVIKKMLRGDYPEEGLVDRLLPEISDCLWYVAMLADSAGLTLEQVAAYNINKLAMRQSLGTIKGDGDNR